MTAGIRSAELRVTTQFVSPLWLNSLPSEEATTVEVDGTIMFRGQPMRTRGDNPFAPGERITIRVRQPHITAYAAAALEAEETQQAQAFQIARDKERAAASARAAAAVQSNTDLRVPVTWRPEIKVVLSGLSENSRLNGANSRTVMHVRLLEALADGGITRRSGDYLCTTPGVGNGSWVELAEAWDDTPPDFTRPVTCKACLKIARRWASARSPHHTRTKRTGAIHMTTIPETAYKLEDPDLAASVLAADTSMRAMQERSMALAAKLGPTIQARYLTSPFDKAFIQTVLRSLTAPEALPEGWVYIKTRKTVEPARTGPGRDAAAAALENIQPTPEQPRNVLKESGLPDSTEDHLADGMIRNFFYAWFVHDGVVYARFHAGTHRDPVTGAWQEIPVSSWHKVREDREVADVMAARAA
jgi:hypothetical protein